MMKLAAALLLCVSLLFSQGNTASLDGIVTDPTGAAIPEADVTVTNLATDQAFKTKTNERGEWVLSSMAAATYKVAVSKQGFKLAVAPSVVISAGVPATVNLKLEIGSATETVEVAA